jgi:hypothetical protein
MAPDDMPRVSRSRSAAWTMMSWLKLGEASRRGEVFKSSPSTPSRRVLFHATDYTCIQ